MNAFSAQQARYAKGKVIVRPLDNVDGWKGRVAQLLDALGCRWTNREHGYVCSAAQVRKLESLMEAGWTGSAITGKLYPPGDVRHDGFLRADVRFPLLTPA